MKTELKVYLVLTLLLLMLGLFAGNLFLIHNVNVFYSSSCVLMVLILEFIRLTDKLTVELNQTEVKSI